ncbi:hypothetical protein ACFXTH_019121 [Malus domestica]
MFYVSLSASKEIIFTLKRTEKTLFLSSVITALPLFSSLGLYSAKQYELTVPNVDLVLEGVRPYLMADGGNVDIVSVEDGVVSLKLEAGVRKWLQNWIFQCLGKGKQEENTNGGDDG